MSITDIKKIKKDFPILDQKINEENLVYLDNAATSQKPQCVIDSISRYYSKYNANVHRGIHKLSEQATDAYENARKTVSDFIFASHPKEVVFTSGTTHSLNLVAFGWAINVLQAEDVILTTSLEHHSNFVPWQIVASKTGAKLKIVDLDPFAKDPESSYLAKFKEELGERVKVITVAHVSNVTGAIMPLKEISKLAKSIGAYFIVDGAQAVPHQSVNMQNLGCDFYAFSAHKMLGPTGIGVLWGKEDLLEEMEPLQYGGGMIDEVTYDKTSWAKLPEKLEAGTPNIAGAIGLSAAIKYLSAIGMDNIEDYETTLTEYALTKLNELQKSIGLKIIGSNDPAHVKGIRSGVLSFVIEQIHAHDIASVLNTVGVAVRSGHHCNMPLHNKLNIPATTRASLYLYNDKNDIDRLIEGIKLAAKILS